MGDSTERWIAVALIAGGLGCGTAIGHPAVALAGPYHPVYLDTLMIIEATRPEPNEVVPLDTGAAAPDETSIATPPEAPVQVIAVGDLPLRQPARPGSAITVPGGGYIAAPGDAPVFVGRPGTQRAKILTPR